MPINMTLNIIGVIPVDFEKYQYIKVFALAEAKNGYGSAIQTFKYNNLDALADFRHMQQGQIYSVECSGNFVSNGKTGGQEFVIETLKFKAQPTAVKS